MSNKRAKTKRKTMHLPPHVHEKVSTLADRLNRPMIECIEEMTDATLRALDRTPAASAA